MRAPIRRAAGEIMQNHLRLVSILSLLMIGGGATASPSPPLTVQTDEAAKRNDYLGRARADLEDWKVKIDDFSDRARAEGRAQDKSADAEMAQSWARLKNHTAKLEAAGLDDWDEAKAALERARRDLVARWDRTGQ